MGPKLMWLLILFKVSLAMLQTHKFAAIHEVFLQQVSDRCPHCSFSALEPQIYKLWKRGSFEVYSLAHIWGHCFILFSFLHWKSIVNLTNDPNRKWRSCNKRLSNTKKFKMWIQSTSEESNNNAYSKFESFGMNSLLCDQYHPSADVLKKNYVSGLD